MLVCRKCGTKLNKKNVCPSWIPTGNYICKKCKIKYNVQSGAKKRTYQKLRSDVIAGYGGKCAKCGETIKEFLTIDHIDGGGRQHRKSLGGPDNFYRFLRENNYPKGYRILCQNCNFKTYNSKLKKKTPTRERANMYYHLLRKDIVKHYGGKCVCCGTKDFKALSIDHTNNNGAEHRKLLGGTGAVYRFLRRKNYPKRGYKLLCMNCNSAKGHYGQCPHQFKKGAK